MTTSTPAPSPADAPAAVDPAGETPPRTGRDDAQGGGARGGAGRSTPASEHAPAGEQERRGDRATPVLSGVRSRLELRWVLTLMLGIAGGFLLAALVGATVSRLRTLLVLLVVSLFVSFAMEPAVQWLARRGLSRTGGTAVVFLGTVLVGGAAVAAFAGLVSGQVTNLLEAGPEVLTGLSAQAEALPGTLGESAASALENASDDLPDLATRVASSIGRGALGLGTTVAGAVLNLLTVGLVTFYLVADGPRLRRTLLGRVEPSRQAELLEIWELAVAKTGGYVYGRLLTALISATVHAVAFTLIGLPYAVALGIFVGLVSSLVPVVGTYIAVVLPMVVALADRPLSAVWVAGVAILYQQVENYLVGPLITEKTLQLHPAVAFVSVLAGAALLGAAGALLALPAAGIVAALMAAYGERHDVMTHELTREDSPRRDAPSPAR